jgi:tetratricopeptide (TPR) repeat protein
MRDDPVLDFLLQSKEFVKKHGNSLTIGLVAVVVLVVGLSIYNNSGKANEDKIQSSFGKAMISYDNQEMDKAAENFRIVAEKYPNTAQGLQSAYMLGSIYFDQGKYDDAKKFFEKATKDRKEFVGAQAIEGIAACYEAKGDNANAVKYLEKALSDKRISYRYGAIRWKIVLLIKSSDTEKAKKLCNEIISDTTASDYQQPAENLIAVMDNAG